MGDPGDNILLYLRNNINATNKHKATVNNEAKTAKMVTIAADTFLEGPLPGGPTEKRQKNYKQELVLTLDPFFTLAVFILKMNILKLEK